MYRIIAFLLFLALAPLWPAHASFEDDGFQIEVARTFVRELHEELAVGAQESSKNDLEIQQKGESAPYGPWWLNKNDVIKDVVEDIVLPDGPTALKSGTSSIWYPVGFLGIVIIGALLEEKLALSSKVGAIVSKNHTTAFALSGVEVAAIL